MEKFYTNKEKEKIEFTIIKTCEDGLHIAEDANGQLFHINKDNQPAYQERYDQVSEFSEGYAVVRNYTRELGGSNSKTNAFHITLNGQPVYENRYRDVSRFVEGRARVSEDGEDYYFIDQNGDMIGNDTFVDAEDFSNGKALVTLENGRQAQIDLNEVLTLLT